ncbi:MAG: hypothetical protein GF347_01065, partial [Candidatus Moranbacteria bacterium]|nr:hypothetical protein [Candidatus Moranbacteria bacterium]
MFFAHHLINPLKRIQCLKDLKKLDKKYILAFKDYIKNLESEKELNQEESLEEKNLPTWQIEKKIILWSFFSNHPIGEPIIEQNLFLESELYRKINLDSLDEFGETEYEEERKKILNKRESLLIKELEEMRRIYKKATPGEKIKISKLFKSNIDILKGKQSPTLLKEMLITQNEILNTDPQKILNNLNQLGFLRKEKNKYFITQKALIYGEILFELFYPDILENNHKY